MALGDFSPFIASIGLEKVVFGVFSHLFLHFDRSQVDKMYLKFSLFSPLLDAWRPTNTF